MKGLCRNDAMLPIQVPLSATLRAFDTLAKLPECMAGVALVGSLKGLVDAGAVDECFECLFIDPLVYVEVARHTLQVSSGFGQLALACRRVLWLVVQQRLDLLHPGEFSGQLLLCVW